MHPHFHHIGLSVTNVAATIDALAQALGATRTPSPSEGHDLIDIGDLRLALVAARPEEQASRCFGDHVAFVLSEEGRARATTALASHGWECQSVRGRVYARSPDRMLTLELLTTAGA
ncbi:MAG: hypothetical protein KC561_11625 [Myxococcales bacterium]|nr:hypothetical protein [Myxococcales bacterium]